MPTKIQWLLVLEDGGGSSLVADVDLEHHILHRGGCIE
jgi:hypothetical protein